MLHPTYKPPLHFALRLWLQRGGGGVFAGHYGTCYYSLHCGLLYNIILPQVMQWDQFRVSIVTMTGVCLVYSDCSGRQGGCLDCDCLVTNYPVQVL